MTQKEIAAVITHVAFYAGWPKAWAVFNLAKEVWEAGEGDLPTEGTIVDTFKAMVEKMFNGAANAKGALVIIPSRVIVPKPGAENKKEI